MSRSGQSSPWITMQLKYAHIFGCDPAVSVGGVQTSQVSYIIPIIVEEQTKGMALRAIIPTSFPMDDVAIIVKNSRGKVWPSAAIKNEKDLLDAVMAAFKENPLFVKAVSRVKRDRIHQVGLIMTKTIVQFHDDQIVAEFYQNFNGVAANVVSDLIQTKYGNDLEIVMGTAESW